MDKELKRFDIILVNFGNEYIGSEQGGIRPAIVVQNDIGNFYSSTTLVMPLTTKIKNINQPTHTILKKQNGLSENSMVIGEGIRQISKERIIKFLGTLSDEKEMNNIRKVYYANFREWIYERIYIIN